ncbi:MAG: hypothetical protein ABW173_06265 [Sphingomonas sp.]
MYRIAIMSDRNMAEVTMAGLLPVSEIDACIAEFRAAFLAGRMHAGYRLLLDVSECQVQTQEFMRAMGGHIARMPKAAAIAVVAKSMLSRMQVRRLYTQPYARVVATRGDGRAWLIDAKEPPADRPAT